MCPEPTTAAALAGLTRSAEIFVLVSDVLEHARSWAERVGKRRQRAASGDSKRAAGVLLKSAGLPADDEAHPPLRQQVLLILSAFGEAWGRCRHYQQPPPSSEELAQADKLFMERISGRWLAAISPDAPDPEVRLRSITTLAESPLRSPFYEVLWHALIDHPTLASPLLPAKQYRFFEACFRLGYGAGLASKEGDEVRRYLDLLRQRQPEAMTDLLVQDMADWGKRHVFGNVEHHPNLPDLPLVELYVEPSALTEGHDEEEAQPVLMRLRALLEKHNLVIVQADMGLGKSLTARHLAWDLACEYRDSSQRGIDNWLPIFIKCAEDLEGATVDDLQKVVQRARWRHATDLKHERPESDSAYGPPDPNQRLVYILDGLDEVVLGTDALARLFAHLRRSTGERQRAVVFCRPQVLPREKLGQLRPPIPVLEILPFSTGPNSDAAQWLERWNCLLRPDPPLTWEAVAERRLGALVSSPILLFMIAYTWDSPVGKQVNQVDLYEKFLTQLARGKLEADETEMNPRISHASQVLLNHLQEQGKIDRDADRVQAMLWTMSRVAWQSRCLEQQGKELRVSDVEETLKNEIKLDRPECRPIALGLLLALQADPEGNDPVLLFNHKSFREYLIGSYWAWAVWRLAEARDRDRPALERTLLEGRLMSQDHEDNSLRFLIEQLQVRAAAEHRPDQALSRLQTWAEECFNDESAGFLPADPEQTFRHDRRAYLREATLAIGSRLIPQQGIKARDRLSLRSLLAWYWLHDDDDRINAPLLDHEEASLLGASLRRANLGQANLSWSILESARLPWTNLSRADLTQANLTKAYLFRADLSGAYLIGAQLHSATLTHANLTAAYLNKADCREAGMAGTILFRADLRDARMEETDLRSADLREADLRGTRLKGAKFDATTQWPEGFDPLAAGALLIQADA